MRYALVLLLTLVLPVGLSAQRGRGAGAGQAAMANRAALERQIVQRFVEQSSRAMGLKASDQGRFEQILRQGNERRRTLAERGIALRQQLMEAIRTPSTSDDDFRRILDDIDRLREEEHAQWRADQNAVAEVLTTPRQRAVFTARWLRLQEVIRDVIAQRPGPGGGLGPMWDTLPPLPGG